MFFWKFLLHVGRNFVLCFVFLIIFDCLFEEFQYSFLSGHFRYRLVNLAEVSDGTIMSSGLGPSTSEVKIGSPTRKKMRVTLNTQGLPNGRGQIGDDLIIDDGIAPKTVTIEQSELQITLLKLVSRLASVLKICVLFFHRQP